ncbi:MAG: alpha/beta fold hydrolase [Solirubrobacteraceae bacterium]
MSDVRAWWEAGRRERIVLGEQERSIFVRRMGGGPSITLLHGFPSSSHDWAKIAPALSDSHALLLPDLLGFGASDKPEDHRYSIYEQADLVQQVWALEGVERTRVIAHDYSVTVTQELLARQAEGRLAVELEAVWLLNGGLYPDLHRPEPVQVALADPEQGPKLSAALTEELWAQALRPTFAPGFDARVDSADLWIAATEGGVVLHRLIAYMEERRENAGRWVGALEQTDVPLSFVWGMLDPISGAHVAERVRERLPRAPLLALNHVGHWPQLEAPERVLSAL